MAAAWSLSAGTVWDSSRIKWSDLVFSPPAGWAILGLMESEHDRSIVRAAWYLSSAVFMILMFLLAIGFVSLLTQIDYSLLHGLAAAVKSTLDSPACTKFVFCLEELGQSFTDALNAELNTVQQTSHLHSEL